MIPVHQNQAQNPRRFTEPLRSVQFDFPRQDAWLLQQLPGMSDFDYHVEVLDLVKALWGLKDAPRAFGLKLAETLRQNGFVQGIIDPQIWRKRKEQKGRPSSRSTPEIKSDLDPDRNSEDEKPTTADKSKRKLEIGEEALGNMCCASSPHTSTT